MRRAPPGHSPPGVPSTPQNPGHDQDGGRLTRLRARPDYYTLKIVTAVLYSRTAHVSWGLAYCQAAFELCSCCWGKPGPENGLSTWRRRPTAERGTAGAFAGKRAYRGGPGAGGVSRCRASAWPVAHQGCRAWALARTATATCGEESAGRVGGLRPCAATVEWRALCKELIGAFTALRSPLPPMGLRLHPVLGLGVPWRGVTQTSRGPWA
ncbi:hypothetical protein NDU88_006397 [Pleurodeles waltl]|uniref:Uncharacterized protein n=1 Tax=Pleurodeles waltl TaxID=8319 RepID=A0AAV7VPN3_PLEWA|nr:hypothetical protein NDU88_006397 [Pleurodeles waltl]